MRGGARELTCAGEGGPGRRGTGPTVARRTAPGAEASTCLWITRRPKASTDASVPAEFVMIPRVRDSRVTNSGIRHDLDWGGGWGGGAEARRVGWRRGGAEGGVEARRRGGWGG